MQSEPVLFFFEIYEDESGKSFVRTRIPNNKVAQRYLKIAYWVLASLFTGSTLMEQISNFENLWDWTFLIPFVGCMAWVYDLIFNNVMYGYGSLDLSEENFPARVILGLIAALILILLVLAS